MKSFTPETSTAEEAQKVEEELQKLSIAFMANALEGQECDEKPLVRKGSWSKEEEEYALKLIAAFYGGHSFLSISHGTTLYTFRSAELFR